MRTTTVFIAAALALAGTAGAASAQAPRYYNSERSRDNNGFWQGAPQGLTQRIDWLQQRIERGRADGSLDREDARRAQLELNDLRRQADDLQRRLDDLSRSIRWRRNNEGYGYGTRDPYRTDYDASRYYREESGYERRLGPTDEVYRGSDGRYYCKRSDGTTGLVIGAVGGATIGSVIAGRHEGVAGALIGGALGALVGQSVDRNSDLRCR